MSRGKIIGIGILLSLVLLAAANQIRVMLPSKPATRPFDNLTPNVAVRTEAHRVATVNMERVAEELGWQAALTAHFNAWDGSKQRPGSPISERLEIFYRRRDSIIADTHYRHPELTTETIGNAMDTDSLRSLLLTSGDNAGISSVSEAAKGEDERTAMIYQQEEGLRRQTMGQMRACVRPTIQRIAKYNGFDLVLEKNPAFFLFGDGSIDITTKVIDSLRENNTVHLNNCIVK